MVNIVQICPYDIGRPGGVQNHILSLTRALGARGHNVRIVAPGPVPPNPLENTDYLGAARQISFASTRFEICVADSTDADTLTGRLEHWPAEILHFHTIWNPVLPWQMFRRRKCAAIATFHDTPPDTTTGHVLRGLFSLAGRYFLNRLDGAIAVSPAPMRHLKPGRNSAPIRVLPPSTDLSDFFDLSQAVFPATPFKVLFLGRLEQRKGVGVLLDAWSQVMARREDWQDLVPAMQLTVAGSGELRQDVLSAGDRLPPGSLEFIDAPDGPQAVKLLEAAHAFVAPSLYGESFGIVLTEAMASGTPVIAAANSGYRTVLTGDGAEGLVPPADANALATAMIDLACDREMQCKLSAWGRRHAAAFDISHCVQVFEDAYRDAMDHHKE